VNLSDPFGLCPEDQRDEDGRCPGGLTVEEWDAVEAAREFMDDETSTVIGEWLDAGKIRGRNMFREDVQAYANPLTQNIVVNRDLQMGNGFEVIRPSQLGFILVHEYGHLVDAGVGLGSNLAFLFRLNRTFYEYKADMYACQHTTAGQPTRLAGCVGIPGR
jgi:hypothetical protein